MMLIFRVKIIFIILLCLLLVSLYVGCRIGAVGIDNEVFWRLLSGNASISDQALGQILLHIRLPRVFAAALVGGTLAVTGAVMQGLFRNPLVDPGIVGVMSGASFAATLSIVLGLCQWLLFWAAGQSLCCYILLPIAVALSILPRCCLSVLL